MLSKSLGRYWDHGKHVVLGCSSYGKNISGDNLLRNSNWYTHPYSSCSLIGSDLYNKKTLKYWVLIKEWTDKEKKLCSLVCFLLFQARIMNFEQCWAALNQRKTARKSSETALNRADYHLQKVVRSNVFWRKLLKEFQFCQKGLKSKFPQRLRSKYCGKNLRK